MATRMQQRRGTAVEWTTANPILGAGEIGFETDNNQFKIGDGVNRWEDLSYFQTLEGLGTSLDDYIPLTEKGEPEGVATLDVNGNVPISQLGNIIDGAPEVLDTLNELAAAISDDPDFFGTKVSKSGDTMTGDLILNADPTLDLQAATKGYVDGAIAGEVVARDGAIEASIDLAISQEVIARDGAIEAAVSTAIDAEVIDRDAAIESAVTLAINTEVSDRDAAIATAVGDEAIARDAAIATAVDDHSLDTTNVHGIADTAELATKTDVQNDIEDHNLVTTNVHGIADTTELATKTYADDAVSAHNSDTTNVHGIADTSVLVTTSQLDTKQDKVTGVSDIEIGYLDGVTSSIQTQIDGKSTVGHTHTISEVADLQGSLDAKLALAGGTMTGKITLDGDPTQALHATTKQYVDNVSSGILAKPSVVAATTENLVATYSNGTSGVGATLTSTSNGAFPQIDGVSVTTVSGQRGVLVKNQTNPAQNGRYNLTTQGDANTPWVLTRCGLCDEANEIPGAYVFVTDGTVNGQTAWVQHVEDPATFVVGTDSILVFQFAGVGTVTAGDNILVAGNEVSLVETPIVSGVQFSDGIQTKQGVPSITTISAKTASYTLANLSERDTIIEISNAGTTTLTIPTDATLNFPVGTTLDIIQTGAGQVTIAGAGGVTVNATPGLKLRTQWSSATLLKRAANTWLVFGDLSA
jgi:hypothetical protein